MLMNVFKEIMHDKNQDIVVIVVRMADTEIKIEGRPDSNL